MHEHCMQQLLTNIPINWFLGPARNIMGGLEITFKIIDGLLAAKETGEKPHLEFLKKDWYKFHREEKEDTKDNFSAEGGSSSSRIVFLQMYG